MGGTNAVTGLLSYEYTRLIDFHILLCPVVTGNNKYNVFGNHNAVKLGTGIQ